MTDHRAASSLLPTRNNPEQTPVLELRQTVGKSSGLRALELKRLTSLATRVSQWLTLRFVA